MAVQGSVHIGKNVELVYIDQLASCSVYIDSLLKSDNEENRKYFFAKARGFFKKAEPVLLYNGSKYDALLNSIDRPNAKDNEIAKIRNEKSLEFDWLWQNLSEALRYDSALTKNCIGLKNRLMVAMDGLHVERMDEHHLLLMLQYALVGPILSDLDQSDSSAILAVRARYEAASVYLGLQEYLEVFKESFKNPDLFRAWMIEISVSVSLLSKNDDIVFDRNVFIKQHIIPQMELIKATATDWEVPWLDSIQFRNNSTLVKSKIAFDANIFRNVLSEEVTKAQPFLKRTAPEH
ncbi:hypothetical protein [Maribacter halichondriae]|uniref:hypothetical protein n=1 Tax=Maribacter halichondriae TaxID=2980554 RepID=UPI00235A43BE|nr:hypothetical protein [Maribacter sp. Hal144]